MAYDLMEQVMQANITYPELDYGNWPNVSPAWCNVNVAVSTTAMNNYDGEYWYWWRPADNFIFWYDTPFAEELIDGNLCYRVNGNIWICPISPEGNLTPEPRPMPVTSGNVKPMLTVTSVRMENHAEHVAVMFGQVLNNLK
jgi:hypothetical protein